MDEMVGLVAVRMASRRLPRKAFRKIGNRPVLEVLIDRLRRADLGRFIVCTSTADEDGEIEQWCAANGVPCFRGSSENVLDRFVRCLDRHPARYAVRITGDNPFTDFRPLAEMLSRMKEENADYARPVGVPLGTACEIIRAPVLGELLRRSRTPQLSEYMTYFFELAPFFKKYYWPAPEAIRMPSLRLTIDFESDLQFANRLADHFDGNFPALPEIVAHCRGLTDCPRVTEDVATAEDIKRRILFD